jgi:PAS domain S-box-containing protein
MIDGFALCQMIIDDKGEPIDFIYLKINDAFEHLTGLKKENIVGKKVSEAIPGTIEANPEILDIYGRVAQTCKPERFELFFKPLSVWFDIAVFCPMKGYFVAVFENITEHKKAEEELREKEIRYQIVADFAYDWEYWVAPDGKLLYVSPSCERITGYPSIDFINDPQLLEKIIHPEDSYIVNHLKEINFEKVHKESFRIVARNGEERWIEHHCQPVFDREGEFLGRRACNREITDRKQAESELLEQKLRAERYLNIAGNILLALDVKGKINLLNKRGYEILGYKAGELDGKDWIDTCLPEEIRKEVRAVFESWIQGKENAPENYVNTILTKFGEKRIISWHNSKVRDEKGEIIGTLSSGEDITERRKAEENLEEYQKNLEKLVEERTKQLRASERLAAIGATAGMVGHDIRNPLQAITGDLFLIEQEINTKSNCKSQEIAESVAAINENILYINKIVSDLQDYTRTMKPTLTIINLRNLITSTLEGRKMPEEVHLEINVEGDRTIKTDVTFIKRIMGNLVSNAVQAMPQGGKLTVKAYQEKDKAVITVEDTGLGIEEKDRPHLFKPLFTTKAKGQGLGLAVVKRFVESLDGTVTFESKVGKGTKFIVELPFEADSN